MTLCINIAGRYRLRTAVLVLTLCVGLLRSLAGPPLVYDPEMARNLCDSLPLQTPEGIWIYPDDNVTVLILQTYGLSSSSLPRFDIRVIETSDVRLHPGDIIGTMMATPERNRFEVELFTERKNGLLLKPKTIIAQISDEGETMVLKKEKSGFNFRFSLNPSILLPKMWRIVRMSASGGKGNDPAPAVGMVKIYPSYDGNGSSRRRPRYL